MGWVVDANVMVAFQEELVHEKGAHYDAINLFIGCGGLASSELIEHEWSKTAGSDLFREWILARTQEGSLVRRKGRLDPATVKTLRRLGMPLGRAGRDIEYIKVAAVTTRKSIVTSDLHFFDPKAKAMDSTAQTRMREERRGKVCQFLQRRLEITVGTPSYFVGCLREQMG